MYGLQDNGELVIDFVEPDHEGDGMTEESIREHEEVTKVKNVNFIELGKYRMETWYFSPLPKEYWPGGVTDTVRHAALRAITQSARVRFCACGK